MVTPVSFFHLVGNFQFVLSLVPQSAMARTEGVSLYPTDLSNVNQNRDVDREKTYLFCKGVR